MGRGVCLFQTSNVWQNPSKFSVVGYNAKLQPQVTATTSSYNLELKPQVVYGTSGLVSYFVNADLEQGQTTSGTKHT